MAVTSLHFDIPLFRCPRIIEANAVSRHDRKYEYYRLEKVYYHVERLWCLNLFLGEGELRINQVTVPIHTGYAGITRPNVDLEYRYDGPAMLSWVHFVPDPDAEAVSISAMIDLGNQFEYFRAQAAEIAANLSVCTPRSEAALWMLLWKLTDMSGSQDRPSAIHPALNKAVRWINLHLRDSFSVADLACEVGLSQNHLNRLFHAAFKTTVADYIRMRRVRRAEHLLKYSNIPLKAIAHDTGLGDVQHFSHVIRRVLGVTPRELRQSPPRSSSLHEMY